MSTALDFVPSDYKTDFGSLPPSIKQKANELLEAIHALDSATDKSAVARDWAVRLKKSVTTIFNIRTDYRKRGWKALVNVRDAGPRFYGLKSGKPVKKRGLPKDTIDWVLKMAEENKLATEPAIRAAQRQMRRWQLGDPTARIPGYDTPPAGDPPIGWSNRNLAEAISGEKFAMLCSRRGQSFAIGACGPKTFQDRAKLWFGSHLAIDDVWHDDFVNWKNQLCRVIELDCLEIFSGNLLMWGTKPRTRRTDGTYDTKLAGYVPLLTAGVFSNYGFSERGTTVLTEHGTAVYPGWLIDLLKSASGGLIEVRASGMTEQEQAIAGWRGKAKGNPRFKGALEVHHRIKHLELGNVPAQTGRNRDERPEYTVGILEDDDDLLKAMALLAQTNPAKAAQLRTRTMPYQVFRTLLLDVYHIINTRTWHKLQGWEKIPGNVSTQYRLAPTSLDWLSDEDFNRLPVTAQDCLLAAAVADKRYLRPWIASPQDVVNRERHTLRKLPDWAIADILFQGCPESTRELKCSGAYFSLVKDQELDSDPLRFQSRIQKQDGTWAQLKDDTYLTSISLDGAKIYVRDASQHFLGVAHRELGVDRNDPEAVKRAHGHQARRVKELVAPFVARHQDEVRAETARLKHNADLLTPDEVHRARELDRRARREPGTITDLATSPDQPQQPETYEPKLESELESI